MAPPLWLNRLGSFNSSTNTHNTADKSPGYPSPSPSPPPLSAYRRLSLQGVDDIDNWLSRLHRLEGALPSKAGLPSPTLQAAAEGNRRASIAIEPASALSTWSTSSSISHSSGSGSGSNSNTPSTSARHHRRRSLALFGHHSYSAAENDHLLELRDNQGLQPPSSSSRPSTANSGTTDISPRPSSQLEPAARPSVLARAHSLLSTSHGSDATTSAQKSNASEKLPQLPDSHHPSSSTSSSSEKTYYEVADGSYIVLTEVGEAVGEVNQEVLEHAQIDSGEAGGFGLSSHLKNAQAATSERPNTARTDLDEDTGYDTASCSDIRDCDRSESHTRSSTPTQDSPIVAHNTTRLPSDYADSAVSITEEGLLSERGIVRHQSTSDMSSPMDSFSPNLIVSSSHSVKSISTTSSHPSTGRLQPRSPFASPKAALSFRSKGKKNHSNDNHESSDVGDEDDEGDAVTDLRGEITSGSEVNLKSQASTTKEDESSRPRPVKKLSKSSFASSIESVRGSLIGSSHDRRESSESKASSSNSHTLPHMSFFARNSSKHPQLPIEASVPMSPAMQASTSAQQYPKLVARDERFHSYRSSRPRFSSARSASSLHLGGELALGGNSSASDGEDESLVNPRRASISSVSPVYQRSKEEKRARLASSNNRISLAIPPPLTRSYSYDARVNTAKITAYDPVELARHIPDMKQTVLLWIPEESANGLSSSASVSRLSQQHGHSASAAKGIANAILSNVPLHGRRKIVKRESTQVLFSEPRDGSDDLKPHHNYDASDKKERERQKHSSKGKEKASILLPAGQWKRCQAVLKASGQLVVLHEDVCMVSVDLTTLQRTDVRLVDPSLLGRQRCLSLNIKNGPQIPLPLSPGFDQRSSPGFPLSPSAPDFFTFSSTASTSSSHSGRYLGTALEEPLQLASGGQTLFLAFPTTACQQAWIALFLCHAQPEVYPAAAASKTSAATLQEEGSQSEEDDLEASNSSQHRPKFTQHSSWLVGQHSSEKTEHPIRMYRSVSLQIIQARCAKEHANTSLAQSLAALALHTFPQSHAVQDDIQVPKRSGSLPSEAIHVPQRKGSVASTSASTVASGDASTGSTVSSQGETQPNTPDPSSSTLPPHLRMTMLANVPPAPPASAKKTETGKHKGKEDEQHAEMFVEVRHNGEVLGRTGIRHVGTKTMWDEVFHFNNLGPYVYALELLVFVIRKHQVQLVGKAEVPLPTIQRNVPIAGWFEVQPTEHAFKKGHFEMPGELHLRALVKEDTSLPFQVYSKLGTLLAEDTDSTAVLSVLESFQIELDLFAQLLLRIDTAHRRVLHRIISVCKKEVQRTDNLGILFRGNTLLTKTIEMYMRMVGSDFLDNTVGNVLRKLCEERTTIEIDPGRMDSKDSLSDNIKALERWCEIIWCSIYNSRHSCPLELRRVLRKVRQIVDEHCEAEQLAGRLSEADRARVRCTSVSAFVSLRFFCPAILRPNLFRLCPSHPPDVKTSRTLTLITKVLMGMANVQTFGAKEPWMAAMNPFLQNNASSYQDFITYLCSKEDGMKSDWTEKDYELYKIPALKRMTLNPDIVKEGVPELPFLIDLPKEYAAFATLVATAEPFVTPAQTSTTSDTASTDSAHDELVEVCRSLHTQTRSRVRALARSGELTAPSREHSRRLLARTEQVRLPMRIRGSTVSKAMSTPSPDRTAMLTQSSSSASMEEARAALFASSPASNTSASAHHLANLSASTSPSMESSSESQMSGPSPYRSKRRSYTIAASPSMSHSHSDGSPVLHSSTFSRPLPAPPSVDEEEDADDIIDIKHPSTASPGQRPARETNPRRLTIIAPRPLPVVTTSHDSSSHQALTASGAKTPRAPTFTREQSDNLRDLQETLSSTAFFNSQASIGAMPDSHREEAPLSPGPTTSSSSSTKRKLFRRK